MNHTAKQGGKTGSGTMLAVAVWLCATAGAMGAQPYLRVGALRWGPGSYRPGQWATVETAVVNPTEHEAHLSVVVTFEGDERQQFATSVWLPPFSQRNVLQPVRVPQNPVVRNRFRHANVTTVLIDEETGRQLSREGSPLTTESDERLVLLMTDIRRRSMLEPMVRLQRGPGEGGEPSDAIRTRVLQAHNVPFYLGGWDGIDCMVIGDGFEELNAAQEESLRRWLHGGGTVWLALDHMDLSTARTVFGDVIDCEIVGRMPLSRWTIESPSGMQWQMASPDPVDMAQVLAGSFEPIDTVDGWPASMVRSVGQGRLYITALASAGWVTSDGRATEPLLELAEHAYAGHPQSSLFDFVDLDPLLVQPDRAPMADLQDAVLRILVVMVTVIAACGLWLARRGRLERLAPVVAVAAVMTAILFIALGRVRQREMPAAGALVQIAQIDRPGDYAVYQGKLAIRAAGAVETPIAGSNGELVWPQTLFGQQQLRRMTWTDADAWRWHMPKLPPRLAQPASVEHVAPLNAPVEARVTPIGDNWRVDVTAEPFGSLDLPAVIGPQGAVPLTADKDGRLTLRFDIEQPFVDHSSVWGNPQDERLEILRSIVEQMDVTEPKLVALAGRDDGGIEFDPQLGTRRLTYVCMPIEVGASDRLTLPPALIASNTDHEVPNIATVTLPELCRSMAVTRALLQWRAVRPTSNVKISCGSALQRVELDEPSASGVVELNMQMLAAFADNRLQIEFDMDGVPLRDVQMCATVRQQQEHGNE